jgi:His-Xaa-Ser system radical SAM maturase HxsC
MKLVATGVPSGFAKSVVGRIAEVKWELPDSAGRRILLVHGAPPNEPYTDSAIQAVLTNLGRDGLPAALRDRSLPVIADVEVDHLKDGDIVACRPVGMVRTLYRHDSRHNYLFATDRCSSNCLMCSQPPKDRDDSYRVDENLEAIRLIQSPPEYLGITGGEPTLLGEGLLRLVRAAKDRFPATPLHILTNGRRFSRPAFTASFADVGHPTVSLGIPLYGDNASDHDYIVQSDGAFDQTVVGLQRLAQYGQAIEIRVVLHRLTVGRLLDIAEFVYRNAPFTSHIALMGLEITGYTPHNLNTLWVDPIEYRNELTSTVKYLARRGMNVSIYNHQLCLLDEEVWGFARCSISDWKNVYIDECDGCAVRSRCGGFFESSSKKRSGQIKAILPTAPAN